MFIFLETGLCLVATHVHIDDGVVQVPVRPHAVHGDGQVLVRVVEVRRRQQHGRVVEAAVGLQGPKGFKISRVERK